MVAAGPNAAPATQPGVSLIDADWADLAAGEPKASAALLRLGDRPDAFLAFARDHFPPVRLTPEELAPMLQALRGDDEAAWKAASERLRYFDPRLAIDLQSLFDSTPDERTTDRLAEVLSSRAPGSLAGQGVRLDVFKDGDGANFRNAAGSSWWAEAKVENLNKRWTDSDKPGWDQVIRGMMLLEHIGTPEARAIVDRMAQGHPDAQPTRVAKEAIAARTTR